MGDLKIAIVDGNNVAYAIKNEQGRPKIENIEKMHEKLKNEGYEPRIIVDATLRHWIDDAEKLQSLIEVGKISEAPKAIRADDVILKHANQKGAYVVSRDFYDKEEQLKRHPWLNDEWRKEKLISYVFIENEIELLPYSKFIKKEIKDEVEPPQRPITKTAIDVPSTTTIPSEEMPRDEREDITDVILDVILLLLAFIAVLYLLFRR